DTAATMTRQLLISQCGYNLVFDQDDFSSFIKRQSLEQLDAALQAHKAVLATKRADVSAFEWFEQKLGDGKTVTEQQVLEALNGYAALKKGAVHPAEQHAIEQLKEIIQFTLDQKLQDIGVLIA